MINTGEGAINENCGSEVTYSGKVPLGISLDENCSGVSFDGDADRLILFNVLNGKLRVIRGEKMAAFCARFFDKFIGAKLSNEMPPIHAITTQYTNSATKEFLTAAGIKWVTCPTGFKHLENASKNSEVAVLFENNGHFKVHLSDSFVQKINKLEDEKLKKVAKLIHGIKAGDGVLNFLLILFIKRVLKMTISDIFEQFECKEVMQYTIKIKNKEKVITNEEEGVVKEPKELQDLIDKLVEDQKHNGLRIFIRPSGTEDNVRVLIESRSAESMKDIKNQVDKFLTENKELNS